MRSSTIRIFVRLDGWTNAGRTSGNFTSRRQATASGIANMAYTFAQHRNRMPFDPFRQRNANGQTAIRTHNLPVLGEDVATPWLHRNTLQQKVKSISRQDKVQTFSLPRSTASCSHPKTSISSKSTNSSGQSKQINAAEGCVDRDFGHESPFPNSVFLSLQDPNFCPESQNCCRAVSAKPYRVMTSYASRQRCRPSGGRAFCRP